MEISANADEMRNCINDVKQFIKINDKYIKVNEKYNTEDEDRILLFVLYLTKTYSWETRKLLSMRLDTMPIKNSVKINHIINESLIMDISVSLI